MNCSELLSGFTSSILGNKSLFSRNARKYFWEVSLDISWDYSFSDTFYHNFRKVKAHDNCTITTCKNEFNFRSLIIDLDVMIQFNFTGMVCGEIISPCTKFLRELQSVWYCVLQPSETDSVYFCFLSGNRRIHIWSTLLGEAFSIVRSCRIWGIFVYFT